MILIYSWYISPICSRLIVCFFLPTESRVVNLACSEIHMKFCPMLKALFGAMLLLVETSIVDRLLIVFFPTWKVDTKMVSSVNMIIMFAAS